MKLRLVGRVDLLVLICLIISEDWVTRSFLYTGKFFKRKIRKNWMK